MKRTHHILRKKILQIFVAIICLVIIIELLPNQRLYPSIDTEQTNNNFLSYSAQTREQHLNEYNFFKTDGWSIAYIEKGPRNGHVILLIHGTPTSSWLYRKIIPQLIDRWYRVIAPDLLWYGASDKPDDHDLYTLDQQTQRVSQLMNHLAIDSRTHVTHDIGWVRTWLLYEMNPKSFDHLVILNTIGYREGFEPPMYADDDNLMMNVMTTLYTSKLIGDIMTRVTLYNGLSSIKMIGNQWVKWYRIPFWDGTNSTYYQFMTTFDDTYALLDRVPDIYQTMRNNNLPVKIIRWAKDKILVWDKQIPQFQQDLVVDESDIHLYDDAAHFIQEEIPDEISKHIHQLVTDGKASTPIADQ